MKWVLTSGTTYRVKTFSSTFVGRYLGRTRYGEHQFDLRPKHGTTTVRDDAIIEAHEQARA